MLVVLTPLGYQLMHSSEPVVTATGAATRSSLSVGNMSVASALTSTSSTAPASAAVSAVSSATTPNFTPVTPPGKPQLGHLGSRAYDSVHGSYTFNDLYLAEPVQVSEQLLPTGYLPASAVAAAAASVLHASTSFATASGPAYITTDSSSGNQSMVFATKGILVFVQSAYQHDTATWTAYLNSLQ